MGHRADGDRTAAFLLQSDQLTSKPSVCLNFRYFHKVPLHCRLRIRWDQRPFRYICLINIHIQNIFQDIPNHLKSFLYHEDRFPLISACRCQFYMCVCVCCLLLASSDQRDKSQINTSIYFLTRKKKLLMLINIFRCGGKQEGIRLLWRQGDSYCGVSPSYLSFFFTQGMKKLNLFCIFKPRPVDKQ